MVQTGLENSLIPEVAGFLGLGRLFKNALLLQLIPAAPVENHLPLPGSRIDELGKPTTFGRLLDLIKAAMRPTGRSVDIDVTLLLEGARGSGKTMLARWAARRAGFHCYELDCYELLGETDLKTEANLAAKFDRAAQCTPCVLILRHIEALARRSQTIETGQGDEKRVSLTLVVSC